MIIDGKEIAREIRNDLKDKVSRLQNVPGLAVILVGEDPASKVYVRSKERACKNIGYHSEVYRMSEDTSQEELLGLIARLNMDDKINGILVQMPLPKHICEKNVIDAIDPVKDVDGFHPMNIGKLFSGDEGIISCTPKGIIKLIESTGTIIEGKNAVIVGRSNIVGKPIASLLLNRSATITICHSRTKDLAKFTKIADILVVAVGKPGFIDGDMVKDGAIVIDVGINRTEDGLVGDVDLESVKDKASYITPVPGGVGPMTIAMLMENTLECHLLQKKRDK